MPNQTPVPSNFIPRDTPTIPSAPRNQKGLADLLMLLSIVLFVASLALAAGVFLYGEYLKSSAASKTDQLARAEAAFEPALIHELTRLDDRMRAAGDVLGGHVSPSAFFTMLEQTTIASIAYTSLEFEATDAQTMTVKMEGVAASVNAIALQADLFARGGMITSPIFSNINREADGIHFNLSALVDPVAINYVQRIAGGSINDSIFPPPPPAESSPFEAAQEPAPPEADTEALDLETGEPID